jgi:hypothetical protein
MQKKVGFSRTGSVQADRLIVNNGLTASTTYNFYGLTAISFNLPVADGTNGQALKTDGAGNLSFGPVASSSTSGTSGTSGANGTSGTSGANGISGTSGTSGANGAAGVNGTSGTSGANGVAGSSGTSGTRGTSGTSGANGAAGANGTSGTSGSNGAAGVNGTSGTSGQSGSSGTSGQTGTSGTSGANGVGGATILGTTNYIPKFTGATALGNSAVYETNSQLVFPDGTAGTPSITFNSDLDTGLFRRTANELNITAAATEIVRINSTSINILSNGTPTSVSIGINDNNTGFFRPATDQLGIAAGGATAALFESTGIEALDGSAATPGISFISDTDTGIYRMSDNIIGFSTNATTRLELGPSYNRSYRNLRIEDGTVATPGLHFTSDQDTGLYRSTTNTIDFAAGGERIMFVDANTINISTTASSNSIQFRTRNDGFLDYGIMNSSNGLGFNRYNAGGGFVDNALIIGRGEVDGGVLFRDGSAATPSISFQNDTDTGIYRPNTNQLGFSTVGSVRMLIGQTSTLIYNQLQSDDGSVSAPGQSFRLDTDTGIYRPGTNQVAISAGGATAALFDSGGIEVLDGSATTPSISFISDTDTGIYRPAVNQLGFSINGAIAGRFATNSGVASFAGEDGTVARPGIGFYGDLDTGIYRPATNQVAISAGGANAAVFGATNSITNRTYFEKAVNHYPVVNATVTGTYTVDMSLSNVFNLTLTGNTTLDYSNQSEGSYILLVKQDGTGGRSLSFASGGKFIGATAVSIGTASNAKSVIQLIHIGTQSIVTYQTNLINL